MQAKLKLVMIFSSFYMARHQPLWAGWPKRQILFLDFAKIVAPQKLLLI
jgi:hypothetical protein